MSVACGAAGAVLVVSMVPALASCSSRVRSAAPVASPSGAPGAAPDLVMVIRHAEKPDDQDPRGVDAYGNDDPKSLTAAGWQRAHALATLFDPPRSEPVRAGLARPTAIFAAVPDGDAELRPTETVAPLAGRLHASVDTRFGKGNEKALARAVKATPGVVLVCWQHGEIPDIVRRLGVVTPAPPESWPDSRFDLVWVFTRSSGGWRFRQVPQLLLPGDSTEPASGDED